MEKRHVQLLQAGTAAINASKAIMEQYNSAYSIATKKDGSLVTSVDLLADEIIRNTLQHSTIPILSEESIISFETRKNWSSLWCVDPLDGTKAFVNRTNEFCVNIALVENQMAVLGVIACPVEETLLLGSKETGAYHIPFDLLKSPQLWTPIPLKSIDPKEISISCGHGTHSAKMLKYLRALDATSKLNYIRKSAALKFIDLVTDTTQIYPCFSPTMEWDIAAGQAILEAIGGAVYHAERNEQLHYNKANLNNPYFIAKSRSILTL
jgi:3'(2'), 5'-bisphosphate nucleotidase